MAERRPISAVGQVLCYNLCPFLCDCDQCSRRVVFRLTQRNVLLASQAKVTPDPVGTSHVEVAIDSVAGNVVGETVGRQWIEN